MPSYVSSLASAISNRQSSERNSARRLTDAAGANGYADESRVRPGYGIGLGIAQQHNRNADWNNFVQNRDVSNPYELAQRQRDFRQTEGFKRGDHGWGALDPATQLQDKLGTSAYNFRRGLAETQANARDDISRTAGETLGKGVHDIRKGASDRGLLYSGLRQGKEGDFRSQVAGTMAKQVAQSNADLSKRADSMDEIAANSRLQGMQQSMQAQSAVDRMNMENSVSRAQQWQQLASIAGYGLGRMAGGGSGGASGGGSNMDQRMYDSYQAGGAQYDNYDLYGGGGR